MFIAEETGSEEGDLLVSGLRSGRDCPIPFPPECSLNVMGIVSWGGPNLDI